MVITLIYKLLRGQIRHASLIRVCDVNAQNRKSNADGVSCEACNLYCSDEKKHLLHFTECPDCKVNFSFDCNLSNNNIYNSNINDHNVSSHNVSDHSVNVDRRKRNNNDTGLRTPVGSSTSVFRHVNPLHENTEFNKRHPPKHQILQQQVSTTTKTIKSKSSSTVAQQQCKPGRPSTNYPPAFPATVVRFKDGEESYESYKNKLENLNKYHSCQHNNSSVVIPNVTIQHAQGLLID
ncbi:hypothetical protein HELRODRAFT_191189 [Helobdella robusta]|uniref:Uncharacterized protein n=1 Tax=Helobdella robusta TaxID=6412 RepID=T1FSQ5_HELRO|nr:hypothetical protein HELRODRAFT_191189 [Helobdella robusta]ESO06769.1 hypothetical protein HELRODRAFT_191189 [Helobdella robusta]